MAIVSIEVIRLSNIDSDTFTAALSLANREQSLFSFNEFPHEHIGKLALIRYRRALVSEILDELERFRIDSLGYHPFIVAFTDTYLDGQKYSNLFGTRRSEKGVAVYTVANVSNVIIPSNRMTAYFIYYLALCALNYIAPSHKMHDGGRNCVFDNKVIKTEIRDSMRAGALCDECRRKLSSEAHLSPQQLKALDTLFALAGKVLIEGVEPPRVFIGSSSEGLELAHRIKNILGKDLIIEVWNESPVFRLGDTTFEALESAILQYEFGIFVFTPDDELQKQGKRERVARNNVLFEFGLFIGKRGRYNTFLIQPSNQSIVLPSDLWGITTAVYDPNEVDLDKALYPMSLQIKDSIQKALGYNYSKLL